MGRISGKSWLFLPLVCALGGVALNQYRIERARVQHAGQAIWEEDRQVVQHAIQYYSVDLGKPPRVSRISSTPATSRRFPTCRACRVCLMRPVRPLCLPVKVRRHDE